MERTFDEAYSVSDLHLASDPARAIFDPTHSDLLARTVELLRSRAADGNRLVLVLNGDTVDFLSEHQRYFDVAGAGRALDAVFGAHAALWDALAGLLDQPSAQLVLTLGNHDLELATPGVREQLENRLTAGDAARRGRLHLAFDGAGYRCRVGAARVLFIHGNDEDSWNVVDHEALRRAGAAENRGLSLDEWKPNGGTKLVVDVVNNLRCRYPFVELLKPEGASLVSILLALDPARTSALIGGFGRSWLRMKGLLSDGQARGMTDGDGVEALLSAIRPAEQAAGAHLLRAAEERFRAGHRVLGEGDDEQLLRIGPFPTSLREVLQDLARGDTTFDARSPSKEDLAIDSAASPALDCVVAGHTHLRRVLPRGAGGGVYLNSGTWARLIELRPDMLVDEPAFAPHLAALKAGTLAALDGCPELVLRRPTVVVLRVDGRRTRGWLARAVSAEDGRAVLETEIEPLAVAGDRT